MSLLQPEHTVHVPSSCGAPACRAFGEVLEAVAAKGQVVAVTNADKAAAALAEKPGFWTTVKVL